MHTSSLPLLLLVLILLILNNCYILINALSTFKSPNELNEISKLTLNKTSLSQIMIERQPGTRQHSQVRQFIIDSLNSINGMEVYTDDFTAMTPLGDRHFSNIIAHLSLNSINYTSNNSNGKKLVLAAHYDSKIFEEFEFVGATDSAVPCALLLDLAHFLSSSTAHTKTQNNPNPNYIYYYEVIEFVFFDGEEAVVHWSDEDSIYGARHLSELYDSVPCHVHPSSYTISQSYSSSSSSPFSSYKNRTSGNAKLCRGRKGSVLDSMEAMILLDLIGSTEPWPQFHNYYHTSPVSNDIFEHLQSVETRLFDEGMLSISPSPNEESNTHNRNNNKKKKSKEERKRYFIPLPEDPLLREYGQMPFIADDHAPFLQRGVPIVHLIPYPFPDVWHTRFDDGGGLDWESIYDLLKIFSVFLLERISMK